MRDFNLSSEQVLQDNLSGLQDLDDNMKNILHGDLENLEFIQSNVRRVLQANPENDCMIIPSIHQNGHLHGSRSKN